MANQTDTPPDPCAAVLDQIKEDKAALEDKERKADLEAQEQAAKKTHAADLLNCLMRSTQPTRHGMQQRAT